MRRLDHREAIRLRMLGRSYNEIAKGLDVGKSLLSYWLKDLELPSEARKVIEARNSHLKEVFSGYNRQKHERVQKENQEIKERSQKKVSIINNSKLLLLGAALYWAEGYKRHGGKYPSPHVSFSNSDPDMIKVFLYFVKKVLKVSNEKIKPWIQTHPNIDKEAAVQFWSEVTNLPKDRFSVTIQLSRSSKGKRPKNLLPYGTLNLRIYNRKKFFEVMGFIDGIIKKTIQSWKKPNT